MADANVAVTGFTTSAITVAFINWLKGSKYFPWITREKNTLLRVISILAAVGASAGIGYVWNSTDHSLVISGLTLSNVGLFLWACMKQFVMNETIFHATKASSNPAVIAAVAPQEAAREGISPSGQVKKD